MSQGLIARIEVQRAYVAADRQSAMSFVCVRCGDVAGDGTDLTGILTDLAQEQAFRPTRFIVEVAGTCAQCRA